MAIIFFINLWINILIWNLKNLEITYSEESDNSYFPITVILEEFGVPFNPCLMRLPAELRLAALVKEKNMTENITVIASE